MQRLPTSDLAGAMLGASLCLAATLPGQQFTKQSAPLGISTVPHATMGNGSGLCAADFDGDGDIDALVPSPVGGSFFLFRNDGGMQFTDVSAASGLGICNEVRCCVAADIDNDGDQDLLIGNDDANTQLFVNQGGMTFTEQAQMRGILVDDRVYGATFGDYDNDGWLDLYLSVRTDATTGQPDANRLFHNQGGGWFFDTTAIAGVGSARPTLVSAWMDYNEDGWVDLILCNDKGLTFGPNELYENNGDGTFTDVSVQTGTNIAVDGMGVDFTDVFCDGGVDFYVTDLPIDHLFQLWDPNTNAYLNATYTYGLQGGAVGWACNWLDYDNDGWQDLHVVQNGWFNLLYRNPRQPAAAQVPWTDVAPTLGLDHDTFQFTNVMADFDDDGRIDILERFSTGFPTLMAPEGTAVYRNEVVGGNWIKFAAEGRVSNRNGFGTRVVVETGSHVQRQWVRNGVGYQSSSDPRLNFGLGQATQADLVTVRWPSGQVQYLHDVPANQIVDLVEPELTVGGPVVMGQTTTLDVSIPGDQGLLYLMMLSFSDNPVTPLPDNKFLPLWFDGLCSLTLSVGNQLLPNSVGVLDANGAGSSPLFMPVVPGLPGTTLYATAVTLDIPRFSFVRTVFPKALPITVQ
ncbi:MAG: CRTAC1 family protein [Planctomycetota bacterium]